MKYILKIHALSYYPEVEISKNNFDELKNARTVLSNGLSIEEKYEILISNYLEFEKEILLRTTQHMIRIPEDYDDFFQGRLNFNIKLVNLLTAARLYVDQLHRHVRDAIPEIKTIKEDIKILFSKEYDNNPEYRFMEALRNYVQHRGIPVHITQYSSYRDKSGEQNQLIYSTEIFSEKELLREDGTFKKMVLDEIPEKVDLKIATRAYVESISKVHCSARKLINKKLDESRSIIDRAIESYKEVYSKEFAGLHAICLQDNVLIESTPLNIDWDDIRIKLTRRNSELVNLRNRHVTSRQKSS